MRLQDIEIVVFLTATIAWGNRISILKSAERVLIGMGDSPFDYVMNEEYKLLGQQNIHRTFFEHHLQYMCRGLRYIYRYNTSLEDVFASGNNLCGGIETFRRIVFETNE